jgi:hypothetical protein
MALEEKAPAKEKTYERSDALKKMYGGTYYNSDFKAATGEGKLPAAQEKDLTDLGAAANARTAQYAEMGGLSSSQIAEENYNTDQSQAILKASMQETSWVHAITQLGFDERTAMMMLEETKKKQEDTRRHYTNLVTTIAKLVVTYYTGGYGAVLFASDAGKDKGQQAPAPVTSNLS